MKRLLKLILVVVPLSAHASAQGGAERTSHGARLRQPAVTEQPSGKNGYDLYQRIAPLVERLESSLIDRGCYFDYAWHSADLDPGERALRLGQIHDALAEARTSGLLDDLAAMAALDDLVPPSPADWTRDELSDFLRPTRSIDRMNSARFVLATQRGDTEDALAAVLETL